MDHKEPLKNLSVELATRRFKTNASLRGVVKEGLFAPYGETKQGKADTSPLKGVDIDNRNLPKGVVRDTSQAKWGGTDKAAKLMRRNGDNFSDYHDHGYSELPRDPVWKKGLPSVATARPDSPFKRSGKAASAVVIVRKAKPE